MNVAFHFDDRRITRLAHARTSSFEEFLIAVRPTLSSCSQIEVRSGLLMLNSMATHTVPTPNPRVTLRQFDAGAYRDLRKSWLSALAEGWHSIERFSPRDVEPDDTFVVSCIGMSITEASRTAKALTNCDRRYLFAAEFFETNWLTYDLYQDWLFAMVALESNRKAAILTIDEPGSETELEDWLRSAGFMDVSYRPYFDMFDDPFDSAQDNRSATDIL
jgi:hypothetical protein